MHDVLPFAPLRQKQSSIRRQENRRWERVEQKLRLRFLTDDGREKFGVTENISGGGLLFATPTPPFRGDRIVCYIDGLGRMSGHVVRSAACKVAVVSDAPFVKRDRLVDQLTWLINKTELDLEEERRASREPTSGLLIVQTEDGRELRCHVMDMSFVGVALATSENRPLIGARVQVGAQQGRVARYLPEGFAVDFTR